MKRTWQSARAHDEPGMQEAMDALLRHGFHEQTSVETLEAIVQTALFAAHPRIEAGLRSQLDERERVIEQLREQRRAADSIASVRQSLGDGMVAQLPVLEVTRGDGLHVLVGTSGFATPAAPVRSHIQFLLNAIEHGTIKHITREAEALRDAIKREEK